jgi:PadR family transcriptional regulator PadR
MGHTLGEFEQLILLALTRLGDDAYGVTIQQEIARRAQREASLGTVYKTLLRLEDKGLVESWAGAPSPKRGGRRKKHYRIAPAGARELQRALAALRGMTRGLSPRLELP